MMAVLAPLESYRVPLDVKYNTALLPPLEFWFTMEQLLLQPTPPLQPVEALYPLPIVCHGTWAQTPVFVLH